MPHQRALALTKVLKSDVSMLAQQGAQNGWLHGMQRKDHTVGRRETHQDMFICMTTAAVTAVLKAGGS